MLFGIIRRTLFLIVEVLCDTDEDDVSGSVGCVDGL